ncbi:nuclear transport factor 2 family protein [Sphingomonas sp. NBWT7]|uniref:nuclear transport factor 2 family protein n=1 Tax=Sphingomonas sp. NBWT7 TaxID=2596913 RepID=UPI00215622D1|nr:nuclear transport factor 2 family protein [Sphingomonas sp. NBWT7]
MRVEDQRLWAFEESLWVGDADHYRELIDDECVMVLPEQPFVLTGAQAIEAVADTPRWTEVAFSEQQVMRPQEGLIAIAYKAEAKRDDKAYTAYCTTTMRRLEHDVWRVVQHQQTVPPVVAVKA